MIKVNVLDTGFQVEGKIDLGYMGTYTNNQIEILDSVDEVRQWNAVKNQFGDKECTAEELADFLTEYFTAFEKKIQTNMKQVNDNFLLKVFIDMDSCGTEFWDCEEITVEEYMPEEPATEVYGIDWDMTDVLETEFENQPNDGSIKKTDVEAALRKSFPMFNMDVFLSSIEPENVCLSDGYISFQCSDTLGDIILCGAYDQLDENLTFTDWHNF